MSVLDRRGLAYLRALGLPCKHSSRVRTSDFQSENASSILVACSIGVGLRSCLTVEVWILCSKPTQYKAAWMLYMLYKLKQMTEETNEMMYAVMF